MWKWVDVYKTGGSPEVICRLSGRIHLPVNNQAIVISEVMAITHPVKWKLK